MTTPAVACQPPRGQVSAMNHNAPTESFYGSSPPNFYLTQSPVLKSAPMIPAASPETRLERFFVNNVYIYTIIVLLRRPTLVSGQVDTRLWQALPCPQFRLSIVCAPFPNSAAPIIIMPTYSLAQSLTWYLVATSTSTLWRSSGNNQSQITNNQGVNCACPASICEHTSANAKS